MTHEMKPQSHELGGQMTYTEEECNRLYELWRNGKCVAQCTTRASFEAAKRLLRS